MLLPNLSDTIAALATPPGTGAIAVLRVAGPNAIALVDSVFKGKNLVEQPSHTAHFGRLVAPLAPPSPPVGGELASRLGLQGVGASVGERVLPPAGAADLSVHEAPPPQRGGRGGQHE